MMKMTANGSRGGCDKEGMQMIGEKGYRGGETNGIYWLMEMIV